MTEELKQRLQELINQSEAIKSLEEADKTEIIGKLLAATPDQMQEAITVLETEIAEEDSIAKEMAELEPEIEQLESDMTKVEKDIKREERKSAEAAESVEDKQKAEDLLKKLDDIV